MPSCVINCCKNNSGLQKKSAGITFHKFPVDRAWKEKWIKVVRKMRNKPEWLPSKFNVVCSKHFEENDMYNTKGGLRRIKKNATPKKIQLVNFKWCQEIEQSIIEPESHMPSIKKELEIKLEVPANLAQTSKELTEDRQNIQKHEDELNDEDDDSEIESIIFGTNRKEKLRQQVRYYQVRSKVYARKIKTLNQKVKRLEKKNASLKSVLKDLKKKNLKDLKKTHIYSSTCLNVMPKIIRENKKNNRIIKIIREK